MTRHPATRFQFAEHVGIFLLLFLCGLACFNSPGTRSVSEFLQWVDNAARYGVIKGFAANHADYPPLSSVVLYLVGGVSQALSISTFIGIKILLWVALLATAASFWAWTRNMVLTALLYLMLLPDSMLLVTLDVCFLPGLLLALWALEKKRWALFSLLYSLVCLIKWQPLIIAPFIAIYLLQQWRIESFSSSWKNFLTQAALPAGIIAALCFLIYGLPLLHAFSEATSNPYLSGNALNFHWVLTYASRVLNPGRFGGLQDGLIHYVTLQPHTMPVYLLKGVFWLIYASVLYLYYRRAGDYSTFLRFSILGYLAYFTFALGVHENHLALAAVLALVLTAYDPGYARNAFFLSLMLNVNLLIFHGWNGSGPGFSRVVGVDLTLPLAGLMVAYFCMLFAKAMAPAVPLIIPR